MIRLAVLLVALSGCAAAPTLTPEPLATRADLNDALFGTVVTLRLADGTEVHDAHAVLVTSDAVRFIEDRRAPRDVRSVPRAEVCEIVERLPADEGGGLMLGMAPGLGALIVLSQFEGALAGPLGVAGFVATVGGALVGRRAARDRNPARSVVLFRSDC